MNIYQKIAADLFLFVLSVSAVCFVWIASSEYGPFIPLFEEILIDTLFAYMGMVMVLFVSLHLHQAIWQPSTSSSTTRRERKRSQKLQKA